MREVIEKYMKIAIEQAQLAKERGENPFGAVLLDENFELCHMAHSRTIEYFDPTAHAEVLVIREYCKMTRSVYLRNHILVCSGEPCVMCSGTIKWAKLSKVFFSVPQAVINRTSGGKLKPSCESIVNTGGTPITIEGKVLLEDGLKVLENYEFVPQDARSRSL